MIGTASMITIINSPIALIFESWIPLVRFEEVREENVIGLEDHLANANIEPCVTTNQMFIQMARRASSSLSRHRHK
jgi:hypothetical protein